MKKILVSFLMVAALTPLILPHGALSALAVSGTSMTSGASTTDPCGRAAAPSPSAADCLIECWGSRKTADNVRVTSGSSTETEFSLVGALAIAASGPPDRMGRDNGDTSKYLARRQLAGVIMRN